MKVECSKNPCQASTVKSGTSFNGAANVGNKPSGVFIASKYFQSGWHDLYAIHLESGEMFMFKDVTVIEVLPNAKVVC